MGIKHKERTIEMKTKFSRRDFLKLSLVGLGSAYLAACGRVLPPAPTLFCNSTGNTDQYYPDLHSDTNTNTNTNPNPGPLPGVEHELCQFDGSGRGGNTGMVWEWTAIHRYD